MMDKPDFVQVPIQAIKIEDETVVDYNALQIMVKTDSDYGSSKNIKNESGMNNIELFGYVDENATQLKTETGEHSSKSNGSVTENVLNGNENSDHCENFSCEDGQFRRKSCSDEIPCPPRYTLKKLESKAWKFNCKFCDFETKYQGNLKEHENSKHEKLFYHLCHLCGFKGLHRSNLNRHIKTVHLKIPRKSNEDFTERFACMYCGFITPRKQSLQFHMNSFHTLENIYPCKFCGYIATRSDSLRRHIQAIHRNNGKANFECDKCDYKTERNDFLRLHVRKEHGGIETFPCQFCDHKATFPGNLKRHIQRKHSG